MEDKIKELLMEIIYKRFENRLSFYPQIELENFIGISAQEIAKVFTIPDVSGQSELLSDFLTWYKSKLNEFDECKASYIAEEYIKSLNCG